MKKLLKDFLGTQSIRKKFASDFVKFAQEKNSEFSEDKLQTFFWEEKRRIVKRDQDYEKKRVRKTISFTNEEYNRITEKLDLTELDFSTFAKSVLLKKKIKLPIEKELIYEVNKIGNNLNQIAKAINQDSNKDRKAILLELVEIEKALKNL